MLLRMIYEGDLFYYFHLEINNLIGIVEREKIYQDISNLNYLKIIWRKKPIFSYRRLSIDGQYLRRVT